MRQYSYLWVMGAAAALFVGVLVMAGCGAGGPTGKTQPATSASLQFNALLPKAQKTATRVGAAKCAGCHGSNYNDWSSTRHAKALVDCESCHGPGSAHVAQATANPKLTALEAANTILSGAVVTTPTKNADGTTTPVMAAYDTRSVVCGQCHSQEFSDFASSPHGQPVADPVSGGSTTCLRCHSGAFRALYVDEGLVADEIAGTSPIDAATQNAINTNITTTFPSSAAGFESMATTATGGSNLKAVTIESPTCTNCHDPHTNTAFPTSAPVPQYATSSVYLRRATSNTDLSQVGPGASTAAYTTAVQVCGACHNTRGGNPSDASLASSSGVSRPPVHEGPEYNMLNGQGGAEGSSGGPPGGVRTSTHVTAPDQCVTCHMGPNSTHTFVPNPSNCAPCHSSSDATTREQNLQAQVQDQLTALEYLLEQWAVHKYGSSADSTWWDFTTNITTATVPTAAQEEAYPAAVLEARTNYYFIILDRSYGVHNYVYVDWLLNYSTTQMTNLLTSEGLTPAAVPKSMTRAEKVALLNAALLRARRSAHGSM